MEMDVDEKIREAIAILEGVDNKFTKNVISLYQRGYELTDKQVKHFLEAAQRHLRSIERGYSGITHGQKERVIPLPEPKAIENKDIEDEGPPELRFKKKYRMREVLPLLDSLGLSIEVVSPDPLRPSYTQYRVFDPKVEGDEGVLFKNLTEFVVWGTNGNPYHPLAKGKIV